MEFLLITETSTYDGSGMTYVPLIGDNVEIKGKEYTVFKVMHTVPD